MLIGPICIYSLFQIVSKLNGYTNEFEMLAHAHFGVLLVCYFYPHHKHFICFVIVFMKAKTTDAQKMCVVLKWFRFI